MENSENTGTEVEKLTEEKHEDKKKTKEHKKDKYQKELEAKEATIKKLEEENKALSEKVLLAQAELINYRKRKDEEVANLLKFANKDLILELIPIADNFERAIKLDDTNLDDELSKFLAGFKMIYSHLTETLKKYGVEEIETVGKIFDPNVHEALMTKQDSTKQNEEVLECLLKGYTLKGKVIRAAKVVVNKLD